jgi:hypothetical protein
MPCHAVQCGIVQFHAAQAKVHHTQCHQGYRIGGMYFSPWAEAWCNRMQLHAAKYTGTHDMTLAAQIAPWKLVPYVLPPQCLPTIGLPKAPKHDIGGT